MMCVPYSELLCTWPRADRDAVQDVVTRYASQTGHHVERRFGWDCHGLPVEFEIDKKLSVFLLVTVSPCKPAARVLACQVRE
jgi:isoleucyl-tRNA synthetase